MATEVPCEVDTGAAGDYPSHNAAEADNYGAGTADLVTADLWVNARMQASTGSKDTTAVGIAGITTNDTHYVQAWCDPADTGGDGQDGSYRHVGTLPAAGAKIYVYQPTGGVGLTITGVRVFLKGLVIVIPETISASGFGVRVTGSNNATTEETLVVNLYTGSAYATRGFDVAPPSTYKVFLRNNTIYGFDNHGTSIAVYNGSTSASSMVYTYANTVVHATYGIMRGASGPMVAANNLVADATDCFYGTFAAGTLNNAYTEGADPGSGGVSLVGVDLTTVFADYVGDDYHLLSDSCSVANLGTDLRSDANCPVLYDIDGDDRGVTPDIGADEYTEEAPATPPDDYIPGMLQSGTDPAEYEDLLHEFSEETFDRQIVGEELPPPVTGAYAPPPVETGGLDAWD